VAKADKLTPWIYHLIRHLLALGLWIKCRMRVHGRDKIPRTGGLIIASNHASFLDPPIIGVAASSRIVRFMARDTLFENKFLAWFYHRFGVVPLDRTKGDVGAIKTAIRLLKDGQCITLFPEGTRTTTGELQEAKGGIGFLIHKAEVPVIPMYIKGSYEAWPKGAIKMVSHPVSVHFGPPISPEALDIKDERGKPDFNAIGRLVMAKIAETRPA
jgi:1-acyl-sn-glycerol-3-phosphate acyltransferase